MIFEDLRKKYPNYLEPQINLLAIYVNSGMEKEAKRLLQELSNKKKKQFASNYLVYQKIKDYYKTNIND